MEPTSVSAESRQLQGVQSESTRESALQLTVPSGPEGYDVSVGETSDEDDADSVVSDTDGNSIVGISIGHYQNVMKSPSTPATEKTLALQRSRTCSGEEVDDVENYLEEQSEQLPSQSAPTGQVEVSRSVAADPRLSSVSPSPEHGRKDEKRVSLIGSIFGTGTHKLRQRSSSGSLLMDSMRKVMPNMMSHTRSEISTDSEVEQREAGKRVLGPAGPGKLRNDSIPNSKEDITSAKTPDTNRKPQRLSVVDSNKSQDTETRRAEANRPSPLRRATSEQNIYLQRAPTGASQFDDYENYGEVSEMVNARFKAITDSLQDSSLRIPKMLSVRRGERDSTEEVRTKLSSQTSDNTRTNAGTPRTDLLASSRQQQGSLTGSNSSSRHPIIKSALTQMSGDLVILGGYRGSILREAQTPHRQLWVPVKAGLKLRRIDLEVGLTREDELKMGETVVAEGILSHIGPVDISRRLLKKCRKSPNVKEGKLRVQDYGYDWRLSPDLLADRFIAYLESLQCNHKSLPPSERGAWVIAHSLGGLITRNAINRRPDLFAGIVYAGTPQNCVNILGPLRNGDDVLFSARVLTAQVNFTLRTSFALLPQNGRCFINKQTGERYDLDFFDVKTWQEYRLSPCIRTALHRQKPEKHHSILGAGSEGHSISSRLFSISHNENERDSTEQKSSTQKITDKAVQAKDDVADTAEAATAPNEPNETLAPSLSDAQHKRPSVATAVTIPLPAAMDYLTRTLESVLKFKQSLSHNPDLEAKNAYPPTAVLFAKNTPTVYGAFVENREAIKYDDAFDELAFAAGDGVVLASAAQLPSGYRCVRNGRIVSERGHVGLLGDLEGVGKCLLAVIEARKRGVGVGAHDARTPQI